MASTKDEKKSNDKYYRDLLELHKRITDLEILEIKRKRMKKEPQEVEAKVHNLFDKDKAGLL